MNKDTWRDYELQIRQKLQSVAGAQAVVVFDQQLPGRLSKVQRQVDILVTDAFAGLDKGVTMAVDCKCWSRRVTVDDMDQFAGFIEDIGTEIGLMITTKGFSVAARARAENARGLKIDVVPFSELEDWRPPLVSCPICGDVESERFPGMAWIGPPVDWAEGQDLVIGIGECKVCASPVWLCRDGTPNGIHETQHGIWVECEGGCGITAKYTPEYDRKGMLIGSEWSFRSEQS